MDKNRFLITMPVMAVLIQSCSHDDNLPVTDFLRTAFQNPKATIELGGPFVGLECPEGQPLPSRIDLFHPQAGQISLKSGEKTAGIARMMKWGLKFGEFPRTWLTDDPFTIRQTPFDAVFERTDESTTIRVEYGFCADLPAMVVSFDIQNATNRKADVELYLEYDFGMDNVFGRSGKNTAHTKWDANNSAMEVFFEKTDTSDVRCFFIHPEQKPASYSTWGTPSVKNRSDIPTDWRSGEGPLPNELHPESIEHPHAGFLFHKTLKPKKHLSVVQIIGFDPSAGDSRLTETLRKNYDKEVGKYEKNVISSSLDRGKILTGNPEADRTILWARSIIAANRHFIGTRLLPVPHPVNGAHFLVTDALLADLSLAVFDRERVKEDLLFIVGQADSQKTIPKSYGWTNGRLVTKWSEPDHLNHLWFLIVAARYYRQTRDRETLNTVFPCLVHSLNCVLAQRGPDGLVWAQNPDMWDMGRSYGPRSARTALTIQALREFQYLRSIMNVEPSVLLEFETVIRRMSEQMVDDLWKAQYAYLMDGKADGKVDKHFYAGALLAAHVDLLSETQKNHLLETARVKLFESPLGVRNVFPKDFHRKGYEYSLQYLEAGSPGQFFNGGIWTRNNAWFCLALIAADRKTQSLTHMQNTMFLDGITSHFDGQPSMSDWRNGAGGDTLRYGEIHGPQSLQSAGWTLYSLCQLLGIGQSDWNLSLDPFKPDEWEKIEMDLVVQGGNLAVEITGQGRAVRSIRYGDKFIASLVIPDPLPDGASVLSLELGQPLSPYVQKTGSVLLSSTYGDIDKKMTVELKAFPGHRSFLKTTSPLEPKRVVINNRQIWDGWRTSAYKGIYRLILQFVHANPVDRIEIIF